MGLHEALLYTAEFPTMAASVAHLVGSGLPAGRGHTWRAGWAGLPAINRQECPPLDPPGSREGW